MARVRIPELTKKKIIDLRQETDSQKALEGIVDLIENYVPSEKEVPIRFDQASGKCVEYEWRTNVDFSHFQPIINLGGIGYMNPETDEPGLATEIVELVKKNTPLIVDANRGKYIIAYEEKKIIHQHASGCSTRYLISVIKANELKNVLV